MKAPLLLNLLPCHPCGVERRFRLLNGRFACEACSSELSDATTASPLPSLALAYFPPPAANDRERLAEHGDRATAPSAGEPFRYGDPW